MAYNTSLRIFLLLILMIPILEGRKKYKKIQLRNHEKSGVYNEVNFVNKNEGKYPNPKSHQFNQQRNSQKRFLELKTRGVVKSKKLKPHQIIANKLNFGLPKNIKLKIGFKVYCKFLLAFNRDIKKFTSPNDFIQKMLMFNSIRNKIEIINMNNTKFKVKLNNFADLNKLKLLEYTGLLLPDLRKIPAKNVRDIKQTLAELRRDNINHVKLWEPINWVKKGKVSPVENQRMCGSCWVFAVAGMIESFKAIQSNSHIELVSRQYLLDCLSEKTGFHGDCLGGNHIYGIMFSKKYGLPRESDYPYQFKKNLKCPSIETPLSHFFNDFIVNLEVSPEKLYFILSNGPVIINIDSWAQEFLSYEGGILQYRCNSPSPNHTVLLVGYGKEPDGTEYWLIKNQWGTDWGEKGYAKLAKTPLWNGCFMYNNVIELS